MPSCKDDHNKEHLLILVQNCVRSTEKHFKGINFEDQIPFICDFSKYTLGQKFCPPPSPLKFCLHSNGALAVCFNLHSDELYGLFESLFSKLQNTLSFESEAAHLRSRGHGREKVHVF